MIRNYFLFGFILIFAMLQGAWCADFNAPLSIDFRDADIRDVLAIVSKKADFNLFIEKSVRGNVSIKATDVPALEFLDGLVSSNGFDWEKRGSNVFVADTKKLRKSEAQGKVIRLEHFPADEMAKLLSMTIRKKILIASQLETNSVIIRASQDTLSEAMQVCESLDKPLPQFSGKVNLIHNQKTQESIEFVAKLCHETKVIESFGPSTSSPENKIPNALEKIEFRIIPDRMTKENEIQGSLDGSVTLHGLDGAVVFRNFTGPFKAEVGKPLQLVNFAGKEPLVFELTLSLLNPK